MFKNFKSEEEIVLAAQSGCKESMEFMVKLYMPFLHTQASQYYGIGFDTDDLVQEGSMALVRAIQKFEPDFDATFYAYAHSAIRRAILYFLRAYLRKGGGDLPVEPHRFFNQRKHAYVHPIVCEREAKSDLIQETLDDEEFLTKFEKECLKLYLAGRNYVEMAEALGITQKGVDNALGRVRQKMRKRYGSPGYRLQNQQFY